MDLLADVLAVSGVRGNVGARVEAGEDRGVRRTGMPGAAFHAVTAGVVWLRLPGEPQGKLMPGDVVLLSTSTEHTPASDPGAVARTRDGEAAEITREDGYLYGSASVRTRIPCALRARTRGLPQVLASLPGIVHCEPVGRMDPTADLASVKIRAVIW